MTNQIKMTKSKKAGFTLVETLVAISILSLSIVATFTAVQNGLQNSSIAKDQTTAFYLAQEAMEFIKNKRDNNALYTINGGLPAHGWLHGLSDVGDLCYFGKICKIDVTVNSPNDVLYVGNYDNDSSWDQSSFLNQQTSTSLFGYTSTSGWNPTIFKREIKFREIVPGQEVEVTIHMSWTSRWGVKSFLATETLFNRQ